MPDAVQWLAHALSFMPLTTQTGAAVAANGTWESTWTDLGVNPNVDKVRVFLRASAAASGSLQWSPDGVTGFAVPPSMALGANISGTAATLVANQAAVLEAPVVLRYVRVSVTGGLLAGGTLLAYLSTVKL